MGMCKGCEEVFSANDMTDGLCKECLDVGADGIEAIRAREDAVKDGIKRREHLKLMVTTETSLMDVKGHSLVAGRLGMVYSERINGINIMKDLFSFVRDIVGGRIGSLEEPLHKSKKDAIGELQKQAYALGANAVIGVTLEHTYNNANSGSILSVSAMGTAVKLVEE